MNESSLAYNLLVSAEKGNGLSSSDITFLSHCKEINWSFSSLVTTIPHSIKYLNSLESLDLTGIGLTELPEELCEITSLHTLILRGNNLSSLPEGFYRLENLRTLDLSRNNWSLLPESIKNLNLKYLNLSYCSFSNLPYWLLDYNLNFVFEDAVQGIILDKTNAPEISVFSSSRSTALKYFTNLKEDGLIVRESKVVFLGDGEAGKTTTVDRIMNDNKKLDKNHHPDPTKGISIAHKDFIYNGETVTLHFWDFGGQQIMHAMHRCFLTGNSLYVIVLSGRAEVMERRLHYWMSTISSFVPSFCPVLVLENQFEVTNITHIDKLKVCRQYKNIIDVIPINVMDASEYVFSKFVDLLLSEAVSHTHYGTKIPKHWSEIKKVLEKSTRPFLTKNEFTEELLKLSNTIVGDELEILDWLNELGTSFSCHRAPDSLMLHEYVVLNPEWATNAIYAIITSKQHDLCSNGILNLSTIENILTDTMFVNENKYGDSSYSSANVEYILELMEKFLISFRIPQSISSNTKEFIPSLCDNNEPFDIADYIQNEDLHFEIQYSYLPSNLLHRFMIDNYNDMYKDNKWWYSGGVFTSESYQCRALVMREIVQNEEDRITIYIHNLQISSVKDESWRYLESIRKELGIIGRAMNITPTGSYVYYSEPDLKLSERISIESIKEHIAQGWNKYRSTVFKKEIPITAILRNITPISSVITKNGLFHKIIAGCSYMQKRAWLPCNEDARNDYLCDLLRSAQILVLDQSRSGKSSSGSGELDFLFQDNNLSDYAIMEALNLSTINKTYIHNHIAKLVDDKHYNPNGLKELYLLVYADVIEFPSFCDRYFAYISSCEYPAAVQTQKPVELRSIRNIKAWKTVLIDGTIIHHIIVKCNKSV